jgi:DNA-directed RNA polymerase subunit RPC12/RpoP
VVDQSGSSIFNCSSCSARYHLVRVEAGPESRDREITCRTCGAHLSAREGGYVLKYFLLGKPSSYRLRTLP